MTRGNCRLSFLFKVSRLFQTFSGNGETEDRRLETFGEREDIDKTLGPRGLQTLNETLTAAACSEVGNARETRESVSVSNILSHDSLAPVHHPFADVVPSYVT